MGGKEEGEGGCVLNWLDAKQRAGLIGPDANNKRPSIGWPRGVRYVKTGYTVFGI